MAIFNFPPRPAPPPVVEDEDDLDLEDGVYLADEEDEAEEDDDATDDEVDEVETLAAACANVETFAWAIPLSARWAYQRGLVVDAEKAPARGVAHKLLDMIHVGERVLEEWPSIALEVFTHLFAAPKDVQPLDVPPPAVVGALWQYLSFSVEWVELCETCRGRRALAIETTAHVLRELFYDVLGLDQLPEDEEAAPMPPPAPPILEGGDDESPATDGGCDGDADAAGDDDDDEAAVEAVQLGDAVDEEVVDPAVVAKRVGRRAALARKLQRGTDPLAQVFAWLAAILAQAQTYAQADQLLRDALAGLSANKGYAPGGGIDPTEDAIDMDLLRQLQAMPDLRAILEIVGRMERAGRSDPLPTAVKVTPSDVQAGRSLPDLLATEHVLSDVAPDLWMKRFLDGEALQTQRTGEEALAAGDLVVLVDHSGSMEGEPWRWANGLAGALFLEALKMGRRAVVARYSDIRNYRDAVVTEPAHLKDGLKILTYRPDGGTDTALALQKAAQRLAAPLREPDIVLITDGGWPKLDDVTLHKLKGPDGRGRLFVLLLEPFGHQRDVEGATQTWVIPQLTIDVAAQVLRAVRTNNPSTLVTTASTGGSK